MYLGEIVRYVLISLLDAAPKPLIFGGKATLALNTQWGIDTSVMSDIETAWEGKASGDANKVPSYAELESGKFDSDVKDQLERVRVVVVQQLGYSDEDVTLKDAAVSLVTKLSGQVLNVRYLQIVRWTCTLVARRAALLSGVAVAAVLLQTGRANLPDSDGKYAKKGQQDEKIGVGVDGRYAVAFACWRTCISD